MIISQGASERSAGPGNTTSQVGIILQQLRMDGFEV